MTQAPTPDSSRSPTSAIICSISFAEYGNKCSVTISKAPPSIYREQQNAAGRMYLGDPQVTHEHKTRVLLFIFHGSYSLLESALVLYPQRQGVQIGS
jgi:hypothetical protein